MPRTRHLRPLLVFRHVSFAFADGVMLLDDLDFSLDGTLTAIAGRNGSGKSVLARLMAGQCTPARGEILRPARIRLVDQHPAGRTLADLSGLAGPLAALARLASGSPLDDDIDAVAGRWDLADRFRADLEAAGMAHLPLSHPAHVLSGGQRMRVALIGAFLDDPALLVLDEPGNHLDLEGRRWLADRVTGRGGVVMVTHDRRLRDLAGRILEVRDGSVRSYGGNEAHYRAMRAAGIRAAEAGLAAARRERARVCLALRKAHDTIQRHAAASRRAADTANVSRPERFGMKAAAREVMGQVRKAHAARKTALDQSVRDKAARVPEAAPVLLCLPDTAVPQGRLVLQAERVCLPFIGSHPPLDLMLHGPVRVAVQGPNGCGKSTLLRLMAGRHVPAAGMFATRVPAALLDQKLDGLDPRLAPLALPALRDSVLPAAMLRTALARLQLDAAVLARPCAALSGGERLKVALAMALWGPVPAGLLLLDEPTNHLDLESTEAFEAALAPFPGAIVAVSHDTDFLAALSPTHRLDWTTEGWRFSPAA